MSRRWIVLALIGMVALGATPESDSKRLRRLEAENRLLKAQIASLKRKLAARKPKATSRPASKPAQPASSATSPAATNPSKPQAAERTYTFTVLEKDPRMWTDIDFLARQIQLRQRLAGLVDKESPHQWVLRNGGFVGQKVQWKAVSYGRKRLSQAQAQQEYRAAKMRKEIAEVKLRNLPPVIKKPSQGPAVKKDPRAESLHAEIRLCEAIMAKCEPWLKQDGIQIMCGPPSFKGASPLRIEYAVTDKQYKGIGTQGELLISGTIRRLVKAAANEIIFEVRP